MRRVHIWLYLWNQAAHRRERRLLSRFTLRENSSLAGSPRASLLRTSLLHWNAQVTLRTRRSWRYYSAANGTSQWYMIQDSFTVHHLLSWSSCPRRPPCPPASPLRRPLHDHTRASPRRPRQSQHQTRTTMPSSLPSTTARWSRSPSPHLPMRVWVSARAETGGARRGSAGFSARSM